jgi:hypothetical protein
MRGYKKRSRLTGNSISKSVAYEVSSLVNSPKNNGTELTRRLNDSDGHGALGLRRGIYQG